jgi:hypothetical protein
MNGIFEDRSFFIEHGGQSFLTIMAVSRVGDHLLERMK